MGAFVLIVAFGVTCLPASNVDFGAESHQTSESAEAIRRLLGEFESAQRSALDSVRKARTAAERHAADRAMPDRRKYALQFLDLVRKSNDEAATVDALVWVVRHGFRTPEGDEAVRKIADRYVRSDRIAPVCHALGAHGQQGEGLLKRTALAAELSKENREAGRMPDEKIEELGKANVRRGGDPGRLD
jgi:hypothetical protein